MKIKAKKLYKNKKIKEDLIFLNGDSKQNSILSLMLE